MRTKIKSKLENFRRGNSGSMGKRLLIILFAIGLTVGAFAQRGGHGGFRGGGGYIYRPAYVNVGVGLGFGLGYYSGFSPYGFYNPWGFYPPPYYYGYGAMPSKLALQIQDIKNDYNEQIQAAKDDKSMTRKDRRARVRELKHDRDAAVTQAQRDYYYNSRRGRSNQPQTYKDGQQPNNGSQQQNNKSSQPDKGNTPPQNKESDQPEYSETGI